MFRRTLSLALLIGTLAGAAQAATLTGGGLLRIRHEYWKNVFDMTDAARDDRSFYRFKTSLWGQAAGAGNRWTAFARLTNENRSYVDFQNGDARYSVGEGVVDNLYVDLRGVAGLPLDLRIGRQDLPASQYAEGFLIGDGTPLDGSRTYYFNACKALWRMGGTQSLELLAINDQTTDRYLPKISETAKQGLNATDESAFALYHRADPSPALHVESYYIWKDEQQLSTLHTVGCFARYAGSFATVRAQAAGQFGSLGGRFRAGQGGYAYLDKNLPGSWKPVATVGGLYLSGDDPSTNACEMWDPLFSRFPWLSELYALSWAGESGTGYWTNLSVARAGAVATPSAKVKVSAWYLFLYANQPGTTVLSGAGRERGQLPQVRADYFASKNVSAYVVAEYLMPGDYYVNRDPALFTRTEVMVKF